MISDQRQNSPNQTCNGGLAFHARHKRTMPGSRRAAGLQTGLRKTAVLTDGPMSESVVDAALSILSWVAENPLITGSVRTEARRKLKQLEAEGTLSPHNWR